MSGYYYKGKDVQSTIMFHQNMDKRLTEKEYQEAVNGYKVLLALWRKS